MSILTVVCTHSRHRGPLQEFWERPHLQERPLYKGARAIPWIPENSKREKALTLSPSEGFTYRRIAESLGLSDRNTGDWKLPLLCKATQEERSSQFPMELVVRGIAPGEGKRKTGGYHERGNHFPTQGGIRSLEILPPWKRLAILLGSAIKNVGTVEISLKDAIATFINHGKDISTLSPKPRGPR